MPEPTETPNPEPTVPSAVPSPNGVAHKSAADYTREQALRLPEIMLLEIGSFYEDRRIKSGDIASEYGISNGVLTAIVDHLGLERRRPGHNQGLQPGGFQRDASGKRVWVPNDEAPPVPEPVERALERMLAPAPEPVVRPRRPEPAVATPAASAATPPSLTTDASTTVWEVQVTGLIHVTGDEIQDAIDAVKGIYPRLRVTGIRQA